MIGRFRLEQKSHYERLVIAQRLSDMLDKFLSGSPAPLEIGAEQGRIEEWDDVVIVHTSESYEHLQIKRQTTDFDTRDSDKAKVKVKAHKDGTPGTPPADYVLDTAFSSLAKHANLGTFDALPHRRFQLTLLGAHLKIKDDLTVNHLDELCNLCRLDGIKPDELAKREDGPTKRAYLWLTTWCGFTGWDQIRDTLRRVTIVCVGNDEALKQRCEESLGRHFTDPEETLERLITYIAGEASDVSALGCHAVVRALKDKLRPDIETWAQYLLSNAALSAGRSWSFAGTHDLDGVAPRPARGVVNHMWSSNPGNRKLRIYARYEPPMGANPSLSSAILRMALHLPNGSQSLMLGEETWRMSVGHEVGHTLGCTESDLKNLPWLENPAALECAPDQEFRTQSAIRTEVDELESAMDDLVWQRLIQEVSIRLMAIHDPSLASAMDAVWLNWLQGFTQAPDSRRKFLEQLLYPTTEGKNAKHALRLGPRTVDLLVTAIEILLLVAVGVGGTNNDWASFPQYGQVLSIALKCWSGPAGGEPGVRELSDDPLMTVIGPSPAPVVILSGVSASPAQLLNIGIADDAEAATSMAAERQPHLLFTRYGARIHLRSGSLASVQQHFTKQRQDRLVARESAIETNAKGL